jgi:hypothetical protein
VNDDDVTIHHQYHDHHHHDLFLPPTLSLRRHVTYYQGSVIFLALMAVPKNQM